MVKHQYRQTLTDLSPAMLSALETELAQQQRNASRKLDAVRKELKRRRKGVADVR